MQPPRSAHAPPPARCDAEYLAHDLQPSRIAETYDVEMVSTLPRERYEVEVYERPEGMTTRQAVVQWINQVRLLAQARPGAGQN